MPLATAPYETQSRQWPASGRHILAQWDEKSIIVYQAYREAIGRFAAEQGYFGGEFKYSRMSWIKTNFLWMMYRSGWGAKAGQEVVLAIRIERDFFDSLLAQCVPSHFEPAQYSSNSQWKTALASSQVRLQWDPDRSPSGGPMERRAIQLGLRGEALARFGRAAILSIEDISEFVREQRQHVDRPGYEGLVTPSESGYPVRDGAAAQRVGIDEV